MKSRILLLALALLALPGSAAATGYTWANTGGAAGNWSDAVTGWVDASGVPILSYPGNSGGTADTATMGSGTCNPDVTTTIGSITATGTGYFLHTTGTTGIVLTSSTTAIKYTGTAAVSLFQTTGGSLSLATTATTGFFASSTLNSAFKWISQTTGGTVSVSGGGVGTTLFSANATPDLRCISASAGVVQVTNVGGQFNGAGNYTPTITITGNAQLIASCGTICQNDSTANNYSSSNTASTITADLTTVTQGGGRTPWNVSAGSLQWQRVTTFTPPPGLFGGLFSVSGGSLNIIGAFGCTQWCASGSFTYPLGPVIQTGGVINWTGTDSIPAGTICGFGKTAGTLNIGQGSAPLSMSNSGVFACIYMGGGTLNNNNPVVGMTTSANTAYIGTPNKIFTGPTIPTSGNLAYAVTAGYIGNGLPTSGSLTTGPNNGTAPYTVSSTGVGALSGYYYGAPTGSGTTGMTAGTESVSAGGATLSLKGSDGSLLGNLGSGTTTIIRSSGGTAGISGGTLVLASSANVWTGVLTDLQNSAGSTGTISTTASAMLTTLTVHGTTGTYTAVPTGYYVGTYGNSTAGTLTGSFSGGNAFSVAASDVWTGITALSGSGAGVTGTITTTASGQLTTLTIHGTAGTWRASNLNDANVKTGIAYAVASTGSLSVANTGDTDPGIGHVGYSTTYSFAGSTLTGTLQPSATGLVNGYSFLSITGTNVGAGYNTDPGIANVLSPQTYMILNVSKTGTAFAGIGSVTATSTDVWTGKTFASSSGTSTGSMQFSDSAGGSLSTSGSNFRYNRYLHGTKGTMPVSPPVHPMIAPERPWLNDPVYRSKQIRLTPQGVLEE